MKQIIIPAFYLFAVVSCVQQPAQTNGGTVTEKKPVSLNGLENHIDKSLKPFYHGLASGDPLPDAVIIWTRVTPEFHQNVEVFWEMYSDAGLKNLVQSGKTSTDAEKDYTVKIDVKGLQPGTFYYYRFKALGTISARGRTKTAAAGEVKNLRLGFASCSNYAWGYFNAYNAMAGDTLDAVVHLGDYIYEHKQGSYAQKKMGRHHIPNKEITELTDYRTRYSQYRLDKDLQKVHASHPFITIWDDHELANNAYDEGAQNHQPEEGDWEKRKAAAKKAYYEWMPVRENNDNLYRAFNYGNLAELIMLDTRVEGRKLQVYTNDPAFADTSRTMIDRAQFNWLSDELNKPVKWKIIGNQVLFGSLKVFFSNYAQVYIDGWEDYPFQRNKLLAKIATSGNVLFATGDFHSSFVLKSEFKNKTVANEIVVPSITSANYDEDLGADSAGIYTSWYSRANPNLGFVNLVDHGYVVMDITAASTVVVFNYVNRLDSKTFTVSQKGRTIFKAK
ncbi:MAG TPA: alkaline phosphatase D family protein [Flavobacteriales bacterium]|nr:alkaline phosphatase D family protein [Flavobacteriales bacterium]